MPRLVRLEGGIVRPGHVVHPISWEKRVIPDSFVLITIVLAVPVVGIVAALIASRIPCRRSDS